MRIGIDARFYGTLGKGLGRYTEKLLQELERQPTEDEFFVFLREENFAEYQPHTTRFHKVLANYPWYGWQEQVLWPFLLLKYRLDLVHFLHFNVPLLYRRPLLVTIHDLVLFHFPTVKASELSPLLYWIKYWVYRFVIGSVVRRAKSIITVSQFTARDIAQAYPKARSKIEQYYEAAESYCVYVGATRAEQILQQAGLWGDGHAYTYSLYVGNAYPHKNLECILTIAERMSEQRFVFVGREDFFYTRLRSDAQGRHLTNVLFLGSVDEPTLSVLYRYAESYLFPSFYEGFGLPGLEAFLYGTPVIAAQAGSLPEILGEAALFFNPHRDQTAVTLIRSIHTNPTLRQRLVALGHQRLTSFSWQDMAARTLAEYHRVMPYARHQTTAPPHTTT